MKAGEPKVNPDQGPGHTSQDTPEPTVSLLKTVAIWLILLVVAVTLGALRSYILVPRLGELRAHQLGTLIGCAAFMVVFWFAFRHSALPSGQALFIGAILVAMTVIFEFGFFHFVAGKPWEVLIADYNILKGRIWILVLLTTLLGPWIVTRFAR